MAAGTTPMNSTDILVELSEDSGSSFDTIGYCTSASLSWSMDVRDVTTKDSGGRREILPGKTQWNISFEGLVTYNTQTDKDKPNNIYTLADGKTAVVLKYGTTNTGDYDYQGSGYFTSYGQEAGVEDNNTYSATFEGTSTLTQAAVT